MFWDSVIASLNVFTYWETYVAGLEYIVIFFVPMLAVGAALQTDGRFAAATGCLSMLIIPVLQVAAVAVFILTLSPIILGIGVDAAWSFPWIVMTQAPAVFFKLITMLVVTALILAIIPILNYLNSLHTLIMGGMALAFTLELINSINPNTIKGQIDYVPGFWFSMGLLIVGGIMSQIGMMFTALLFTVFGDVKQGIGAVMMPLFGAIFGFIPVFIYGAWLGNQIKGSF